ncbi:putative disease resistance protein At3g14460 [Gossypium hirsutum]|uniref:Disease resistance protein At3g14460 n=1 Tax=Gossypium hirsutum TaxID=3635 RepID=A0ABM2YXE9_GOSHI|nr:putative disease resistance protein At3g14460 [Gossypium hirsutum]
MENLVNLCYLDITGSNKLEGIPSNVGKLADLQTLSNFVLDEDKGYQIRELKDLSNLKGKLSISGLQNIFEPQDAWMAKLCDKSRLEKIELRWSKDFKNERQYVDKKVLMGFNLPKTLRSLASPSIVVQYCPKLLSLPSIGKFPLLKEGNWNLSEVDEEARKFPKLRELLIRKYPLLSGSMPEHLPSLEKLSVSDCEKLIIPIQNFPMLSELKIERCKKVVYKGFAEDSSLKRVLFSGISKFSCAIECLMLKSIKVESLEIDDCCEELCFFRENNWGWLTQSMSIGVLSIGKCPQVEELMQLKIPCNIEQMKIKKFGRLEKLSTTLHFFSSLTMVELYDCPKLISLERSNLPWNLKVLSIYFCENLQFLLLDEDQNVNSNNACVLQELEIYSCESLKRINKNSLPSTLKQLKLKWCSKLESIAREVQDNSCLESIDIISCHMIKDLPQGSNQLKHLQSVNIWSCSNLICFPDNGLLLTNLKVLLLANCELLQGLPEGVHNLNSLEELVIKYCRNVTISFPEGVNILTNLRSLNIEGSKSVSR